MHINIQPMTGPKPSLNQANIDCCSVRFMIKQNVDPAYMQDHGQQGAHPCVTARVLQNKRNQDNMIGDTKDNSMMK